MVVFGWKLDTVRISEISKVENRIKDFSKYFYKVW